jgi:hypothetical protein
MMPLFLFILIIFNNIHTFIQSQYIHPSPFAEASPYPHRLCAQWGKLPCGAEPRIELGHALQQADALPTEPRRPLLSHAAPFLLLYDFFR